MNEEEEEEEKQEKKSKENTIDQKVGQNNWLHQNLVSLKM